LPEEGGGHWGDEISSHRLDRQGAARLAVTVSNCRIRIKQIVDLSCMSLALDWIAASLRLLAMTLTRGAQRRGDPGNAGGLVSP
jgi:hypothetical protein